MATRGAIVRRHGDGFAGVYHHWDSYPEGLGKTLWDLYRGHFQRDIDAMLRFLIEEHPAGWSSIVDADFSLEPGFTESRNSRADDYYDGKLTTEEWLSLPQNRRPHCYCHGDRSEEPWLVTHENASGSGVEWVYYFNPPHRYMAVLRSLNPDGKPMIGMFGSGNPEATWVPVAIIDLDGQQEPPWEEIAQAGMAWAALSETGVPDLSEEETSPC